MPTLERIGYVNIFISDFERSLIFYEQLGFVPGPVIFGIWGPSGPL